MPPAVVISRTSSVIVARPELRRGSLLGDLATGPDERFHPLIQGAEFRLVRIVSAGHKTPGDTWYDQDDDEWVVVIQGEAELLIEDQASPLGMRAGDWVLIPAHCRHRVTRTSIDPPTVWLALHANIEVSSG